MTKRERLAEINKELKALAEEKKRLLAEIEAEKESPAATNKTRTFPHQISINVRLFLLASN